MVITTAATSLDDQHDLRRRKYLIMMGLRVICVIAAVVLSSVSLWLSLLLIAGGAVLPWCAVLIANDRPAQRSTAFVRYRPPSVSTALDDAPVGPTSSAGSGPRRNGPAGNGYVIEAGPTPFLDRGAGRTSDAMGRTSGPPVPVDDTQRQNVAPGDSDAPQGGQRP